MVDKVRVTSEVKNGEGTLVIEPLPQSYGVTLGNSLRRVLLTSLPGAAITQVKITGVTHEYSTIRGVKEDVVELLLNLKKVRLKIESDKPVKLSLDAKGAKVVTAKDIEVIAGVEIANNFDKLILNITTDGTITPQEAVKRGAQILTDYFNVLVEQKKPVKSDKVEKPPRPKIEKDATVEELELSTRITNSLRNAGIDTVEDLLKTPKEDLVKLKNMGAKSISDIEDKLKDKGLTK